MVYAVLRKAEAAGYRVAKGDLAPHDQPRAARLDPGPRAHDAREPGVRDARRRPARAPGRRGRGLARVAPDARARDRRPRHRGHRPADAARLRGPPVGRRAQPRGHRRARAPRARAAAAPARCLPARRAAGRVRPPRVAGAADQPAARRGGPAQAPHAGRDGARGHAHPGDRPAGAARGRRAPCTSGPMASRSTSRSCSPRWTTRPGPTAARSATRRCRTRSRTRCWLASARLSDDARAVARAGAVIGRCFVPEVLAGCMDRPVADLEAPARGAGRAVVPVPVRLPRPRLLRLPPPAPPGRAVRDRGTGRAAPPPRPRGRVRVAAGRLVGDPRLGALRAGRPARAGLPDGAGRGARRECRLESARGVRALPARRGERTRRPPGRGARGAVRGLLRGGSRGRRRAADRGDGDARAPALPRRRATARRGQHALAPRGERPARRASRGRAATTPRRGGGRAGDAAPIARA